MRVVQESILDCPADTVWAEVHRPALLSEVAAPVLTFVPLDEATLPQVWRPHQTLRLRLYAFSIISLGEHSIFVESLDEDAREIRTREVDTLCRRWDHVIRVEDAGGGRSRYRDELIIEAGRLTFFVWLFASLFFRHRHRRWATVARRLAATGRSADQSS
jgi:hypothetical protein